LASEALAAGQSWVLLKSLTEEVLNMGQASFYSQCEIFVSYVLLSVPNNITYFCCFGSVLVQMLRKMVQNR